MQVKPKVRYHFTPPRMAKIKQNNTIKFMQRCKRTETLYIAGGAANRTTTLRKLFGNFS